MPRISVISTSINEDDFECLKNELSKQTLHDFELIFEPGHNVPATWNRAISRANGEILVFLDASAKPVNEYWLEELTSSVTDQHCVVKGPEITSTPLDPSSLAGYRQAFIDHPFDESYPWSEDTELFCRLREAGYRFLQLDCAPVIHLQKPGSKTYLRRAFRYGLYMAKLRHRYADPIELMSLHIVFKRMIAAFLNLLGVWVGSVIYTREKTRIVRKSNSS